MKKDINEDTVNQIAYADGKSKGMCGACFTRPAIRGEALCVRCKQKRKLKKQHKQEIGECQSCPNPTEPGYLYCPACRAKKSKATIQRELKLKKQGLCMSCGKNAAEVGTERLLCLRCWVKEKDIPSVHVDIMLDRLKNKQNFIDPYTGDELIPGNNATIDHSVPRDLRGGTYPSNLCWVTDVTNKMKSNMTPHQFIRLCKKIAKRFPDDPDDLQKAIDERIKVYI